jgi:hypothetical protein
MSYSERYSASVPFSGSVSYTYPASEHGGSGRAHYSGDVPVYVTINVNTEPFDGSVGRFKTSIDALGASVVAMNAAQCAAIHQTAKEVSASLIKGFFGTINSELSQQIQALDSAVKAKFGLIQQQGIAVTEKKNDMEKDYNRISSRYADLFADLDSECYKRIFALDKQSFNLSEKVQKELLSESLSNTAAVNLLGIEEVSSSKTLVFVSSMNRKSLKILKTLHEYITQESNINSLINSFLVNEEIDEKIQLCIPALWIESDMTEGQGANHECFFTEYIDQQSKREITEKTNAFCEDESCSKWKPLAESEKESLNREFNILAESSFANNDEETEQRIYKTMLSLWKNAELSFLDKN